MTNMKSMAIIGMAVVIIGSTTAKAGFFPQQSNSTTSAEPSAPPAPLENSNLPPSPAQPITPPVQTGPQSTLSDSAEKNAAPPASTQATQTIRSVSGNFVASRAASLRNSPTLKKNNIVETLEPGEALKLTGETIGLDGKTWWVVTAHDGSQTYLPKRDAVSEAEWDRPKQTFNPTVATSMSTLSNVQLLDFANVLVNGKSVEIAGIQKQDGPTDPDGEQYLMAQIQAAGGSLRCTPSPTSKGSTCLMGNGQDIAFTILGRGLAKASADATPGMLQAQATARRFHGGVWRTTP